MDFTTRSSFPIVAFSLLRNSDHRHTEALRINSFPGIPVNSLRRLKFTWPVRQVMGGFFFVKELCYLMASMISATMSNLWNCGMM